MIKTYFAKSKHGFSYQCIYSIDDPKKLIKLYFSIYFINNYLLNNEFKFLKNDIMNDTSWLNINSHISKKQLYTYKKD